MNDMDSKAHKETFARTKAATEALVNCNYCHRQCGINRTSGDKGYCGLDDSVRFFREILYYGEEKELVPSHQIHFAGCNLRCEFCVVSEWNEAPLTAEVMDFDKMASRIAHLQRDGAKTLNFVGGEPTLHLHGVLELLSRLNPGIKVVWNSNMYYNDIVDELMAGLVDIYLADFKCGNNTCSEILLGADNYVEVVKQNILKAAGHADVIVRHVVLPGHGDCCLKPILTWLKTEIPNVKLSLRDNYVPPVQYRSAPCKYLEPEEMRSAQGLAKIMGLKLVK